MTDLISIMDNAQAMETLYQKDKSAFKKEFYAIYGRISDNKLSEFWHERLKYDSSEISFGSWKDISFVLGLCLVAGLIAELPVYSGIDSEFFYARNLGFIIFPLLSLYFSWKNGYSTKKMAIAGILFLVALVYINILPNNNKSHTLILSCIHLVLFQWSVLGYTFLGNALNKQEKMQAFLSYNGELIIMSTLLAIAGGILSGLTIGLFSIIGLQIEEFYGQYVIISAAAALPIVATYVTQTNPELVNKVSPLIAKIFSPLILIMLVIYLSAIFFAGKDPYRDRDFLMAFNFLLIGVMAIILFSAIETAKSADNKLSTAILFALSLLTIIVNSIAMSAILFRISEWGLSANRAAILGANVLILTNLAIVSYRLFSCLAKKENFRTVVNSITKFLPVYVIWIIIVTFIFPLIFHFS